MRKHSHPEEFNPERFGSVERVMQMEKALWAACAGFQPVGWRRRCWPGHRNDDHRETPSREQGSAGSDRLS